MILPLEPLLGSDAVISMLDEIFFEASSRQNFADDKERQVFRERWLGRYLGGDARHGFAAVLEREAGALGRVVGYVVGSHDNPALSERFADIGYFQDFQSQCLRYPAHLHINIHSKYRCRGIGARLIDAFCKHLASRCLLQAGASTPDTPYTPDAVRAGQSAGASSGVHVVTSAESRNVGFYNRQGFIECARKDEGSGSLVFLGRAL